MDIRWQRRVIEEVVVTDLDAGEKLSQAIESLRRILREEDTSIGAEPKQPPLEEGAAYSVRRERLHVRIREPLIDRFRPCSKLAVSLRGPLELLARARKRECTRRLSAQRIPCFCADEVISHQSLVNAEIEVVSHGDLHVIAGYEYIRGQREMRGRTSRLKRS